jgi:hypothetical protein
MPNSDGQKLQEYLTNVLDGLQPQTTRTTFLEKTFGIVQFMGVTVVYANT